LHYYAIDKDWLQILDQLGIRGDSFK